MQCDTEKDTELATAVDDKRTRYVSSDNTKDTQSSFPDRNERTGTGSMIFFSQMDARMTNAWLRAIRGP